MFIKVRQTKHEVGANVADGYSIQNVALNDGFDALRSSVIRSISVGDLRELFE